MSEDSESLMATSSLLDDCQTWIEKKNESWKSYFSKWEIYAKFEENLGEEELTCETNEECKSKGPIKVKQPLHNKRLKTLPFKRQQLLCRVPAKKKTKCKKLRSYKGGIKLPVSPEDNVLSTVIENNQLEITLKTAFLKFLKDNKNKFQIFSVLFQTYSHGKLKLESSGNLTIKENVFPSSNFYSNIGNCSFEKQMALLLPSPQTDLSLRSVSPDRNSYVQSFYKDYRGVLFRDTCSDWISRKYQCSNNFSGFNCNTNSINEQSLVQVRGTLTPPVASRLNLEVKSCPPFYRPRFQFKKAVVKCLGLDFSDCISTNSGQKTNKEVLKNTDKVNLTQERKKLGDLCLHKRTNSVNLSIGNSNFITPGRNSSEQKCFNKSFLERRHQPKKLFFDIEEEDSDSDDQTPCCSPVIHCQNKRLKLCKSKVVESDLDDCESILDRVK